jgi:hypothetical protein
MVFMSVIWGCFARARRRCVVAYFVEKPEIGTLLKMADSVRTGLRTSAYLSSDFPRSLVS